jgi:hypothetical protein
MKDHLAELVRASPTPTHGRNVVGEYLQARILGCLQRAGAMIPLACQGSAALRFLHGSALYPEHLDFALERARSLYDMRAYLRAIQGDLAAEGYAVEITVRERRVVRSVSVHLPGLLDELGIASHQNQELVVTLRVDTDPPAGAVLATTVVRRHETLHLQHHDRASLLAGTLHRVLRRPHLRGRDIYGLFWSLSDPDWPGPNLNLLNSLLQRTGWDGPPLTEHNWREVVRDRLQAQAWDWVVADVGPFLEPNVSLGILTPKNVMMVLK